MVTVKLSGKDYELRPTKIMCLLRNYAAHAEELGHKTTAEPKFFLKPPSSLQRNNKFIRFPPEVYELHHEVELAVIISKSGSHIPENRVQEHIKAYTVILDITARDVQRRAKEAGLPWSQAKGYDTFAPVGPAAYTPDEFDWRGKKIWLKVNGEMRQEGNTDLMLFSVERIVSHISSIMSLREHDIILTGTPAGVGPLYGDDRIEAGIEGMEPLTVDVI